MTVIHTVQHCTTLSSVLNFIHYCIVLHTVQHCTVYTSVLPTVQHCNAVSTDQLVITFIQPLTYISSVLKFNQNRCTGDSVSSLCIEDWEGLRLGIQDSVSRSL